MQAEAQAGAYTESLAARDLEITGLRSTIDERLQAIKTLEVSRTQHAFSLCPLMTQYSDSSTFDNPAIIFCELESPFFQCLLVPISEMV